MSQFIDLPKNIPLEAPAILKGILSKVIEPAFNPRQFTRNPQIFKSNSQLSSNDFKTCYNLKTQKRFVEEVKYADQLQHVFISKEYQKMKKNLGKYGKSHSFRTDKIVNNKKAGEYFQSREDDKNDSTKPNQQKTGHSHKISQDLLTILKKQQKYTKIRHSPGSVSLSQKQAYHDRIVFVDRKYNNQFSVKLSSLVQAEAIKNSKQNYVKFLSSYKQARPLISQAHKTMKRMKYKSAYEKQSIEGIELIKDRPESVVKYKRLNRKWINQDFKKCSSSYYQNGLKSRNPSLTKVSQYFDVQMKIWQGQEQNLDRSHKDFYISKSKNAVKNQDNINQSFTMQMNKSMTQKFQKPKQNINGHSHILLKQKKRNNFT